MGRTLTIPSSPRRNLDSLIDAAGWEPLQAYLTRLRGR